MKKAYVTTSVLGSALLCLSLAVNAEPIEQNISGSTLGLGEDASGAPEPTVSHGTSRFTRNGKPTKEGTSFIINSKLIPNPTPPGCTFVINDFTVNGVKFVYEYSDSVSTLDNGDLLIGGLDPNEESYICINPFPGDLLGVFEIRGYRIIEGGTGAAGSACGYLEFVGYGRSKGGSRLSAYSGTQTGEVFAQPGDAPPGTVGCDS